MNIRKQRRLYCGTQYDTLEFLQQGILFSLGEEVARVDAQAGREMSGIGVHSVKFTKNQYKVKEDFIILQITQESLQEGRACDTPCVSICRSSEVSEGQSAVFIDDRADDNKRRFMKKEYLGRAGWEANVSL